LYQKKTRHGILVDGWNHWEGGFDVSISVCQNKECKHYVGDRLKLILDLAIPNNCTVNFEVQECDNVILIPG